MTLAEVQMKWSGILKDRLSPDIFSRLQRKGHVLHRARAHLKCSGLISLFGMHFWPKCYLFLSRLSEINGGCEKILPASGSFWSKLKFVRMMDIAAWLWCWNASVNGIRSIIIFLRDVCHCWLPINLLGAMMARDNRSRIATKHYFRSLRRWQVFHTDLRFDLWICVVKF